VISESHAGRVFVFVFSLGYLTVLPAKNLYVWWSEPNLSRLPKGKLALGPGRTAIVGLVSWIIVIICQGVVAKTAGHAAAEPSGARKYQVPVAMAKSRRNGWEWMLDNRKSDVWKHLSPLLLPLAS
jgi:hypothetical protein